MYKFSKLAFRMYTSHPLVSLDQMCIRDRFKDVKEKVEQYLNVFKFREAQKEAMNLARIGNRYITCLLYTSWPGVQTQRCVGSP